MQAIKFGKIAALVVAFGVIVGCSSKGGDTGGTGAVDPNAGYTSPVATGDNMSSEEAALRADVHAKDLRAAGNRVVLEGHTDERGSREYNMALGERRAAAVQRYLAGQGVSPSQLELVSYGEEKAAVMGSSEEAYAQNRRVELRK